MQSRNVAYIRESLILAEQLILSACSPSRFGNQAMDGKNDTTCDAKLA